MDRRQFLIKGITVPVVATAGCIGNSEPTVQLAGVRVANFMDEPIKIDVVIQKAGSTVQTECVEVQAAENGSGTTFEQYPIECTWRDDEAEYVIEARLNDGDWVANEIAKNLDVVPDEHRNVVAVEIQIYRDNEIVFNPQGCDLLTTGTIPPWTCPWVEC
ncbi:Uncharacterized protein AArcCO_4025 (plasmid) [Halalkaliarchaeum sp. AArc-CO]|uniref:hypothetical protein n=1 Tax=Halalkaliarchaeum sp. AArc-CO TaxID=2866381 RepID=UPI00217DDCF7|nr:hypothetical protein [Halalkaliarchaeum sp. AArc-CO]UWG49200.1 Uncharacterized protein AArcCO_4025 [Halalkaliarchaeum sp. AArc-CO]